MTEMKRAFLWASAGRYLVLIINLGATLIIARLLGPREYGISVIGTAIFGIAEAVRELGGGAYLIQQTHLSPEKIRTTITISLIITLLGAGILVLFAQSMAQYFDAPGLDHYLRIIAFGFLLGPYLYPIFALMSREFEFGVISLISVFMALISSVVSVFLALFGFSYMSLAWATVVSTVIGTLLCFYFRRDPSIYRPKLSEWRGVIGFGISDSSTAVCYRVAESLTYLILSRFLSAAAVGLAQRAMLMSLFPERVILAGVGAVALPGFSRHVRSGRQLKDMYLRAMEHITAVQWPALITLALLAHPIVHLVLGKRWPEVAPLIQILNIALLFSFPINLQYPVLVAVGAIRYVPLLVVVQSVVMLTAISATAAYGLHAVLFSMLLVVPLNAFLSVLLVRRYVPFRYAELAAALIKSVLVSATSAAGPLAVVIASGWRTDLSYEAGAIASFLSGLGWIGGLWLTRHPLLAELLRVGDGMLKTPIAVKAAAVVRRLGRVWR